MSNGLHASSGADAAVRACVSPPLHTRTALTVPFSPPSPSRSWDLRQKACAMEICGAHSLPVYAVLPVDEHHVLSASSDRLVKLWDWRTRKALATLGERWAQGSGDDMAKTTHTAWIQCMCGVHENECVFGALSLVLVVWPLPFCRSP